MTSKEKAEQMYQFYLNFLPDAVENDKDTIKGCALIAIDEMIDFRNALYMNEGSLAHEYLLKVKQEIENL